ncbi:MAG: NAD(P)/FAD-dependent oxidoreductase [Actinomycetes bacterium]
MTNLHGSRLASADVVVLGAGIIGAAITRELARAGVAVLLVDAAGGGTGTSGRCDGNVLLQTKHDVLGVQMTKHSIVRYAQWAAELELDIHFERPGSLVFFSDPKDLASGHERVDWLASQGVAARFVDARQIHDLEPGLSDRAVGGIDCLDDSSVYPPAVVAALVHDARRHGAGMLTHVRARRLLVSSSDRVEGVDTDAGVIAASQVVNALGPWSPFLEGDVGTRVPVIPRQGLIAVTDEASGLVRRAVTEATYMSTRASAGQGDTASVAFVAEPTFRGNVLIGSTRRFCGYDMNVDLSLLMVVMRRAISFLPGLADVQIIRTFAGLRPWSPDNRPLIGASKTVAGYFLATGHEGEGIGLAPITADIITALVTSSGLTPLFTEVLANTDPQRFGASLDRAAS